MLTRASHTAIRTTPTTSPASRKRRYARLAASTPASVSPSHQAAEPRPASAAPLSCAATARVKASRAADQRPAASSA